MEDFKNGIECNLLYLHYSELRFKQQKKKLEL